MCTHMPICTHTHNKHHALARPQHPCTHTCPHIHAYTRQNTQRVPACVIVLIRVDEAAGLELTAQQGGGTVGGQAQVPPPVPPWVPIGPGGCGDRREVSQPRGPLEVTGPLLTSEQGSTTKGLLEEGSDPRGVGPASSPQRRPWLGQDSWAAGTWVCAGGGEGMAVTLLPVPAPGPLAPVADHGFSAGLIVHPITAAGHVRAVPTRVLGKLGPFEP